MSTHETNIVVAALIHDSNNKIFIARRAASKAFHPNMFECIGGHLDQGETPEQGLSREVFEEVQAHIRIGKLVDAFTYTDDEAFKVELSYLCEFEDGEQPKLNPDDHSEFMWIGKDEVDKFEKEDEETAALRKAFRILEGER